MFLIVLPIHSPLPDLASHATQIVPAVQAAALINAQAVLQTDLFSQTGDVCPPAVSHSFSTPRLASPVIPVVQAAQARDPTIVLHVQVHHKFL